MTPYRAEIEQAAVEHGIDANLLDALVSKESSYKPSAYRFEPAFWERYLKHNPIYAHANPERVSASYGLAQVMYPTAVDHGFTGQPEDLFGVARGLQWGAVILGGLLEHHSFADALAAYNGGVGGVHQPIPQAYARDVLKRYDVIKAAHA